MAYFNDPNNTDFYSSVSGGFYSYPPPSQTFAIDTQGINDQTYTDPTNPWSMVRQSGPMVEPTNLWATANSESIAPTTSYTSRSDGYSWPSYDPSADYRQAQSQYSGYLSRDDPFTGTIALGTSTASHIPSRSVYSLEEFGDHRSQTVPLDYWGTNQSVASTSASYVGNVNTHWPTTGPTRAEITRAGRYQPYGVSCTCQNRYGNAEAGPSTLVAPPVPYVGLPPTQPSGGISETMANAKTENTVTEEHRAAKPKRGRVPRGQGEPRISRIKSGAVGRRLCGWVRRWRSGHEAPTFNQALAVAAEIARRKRDPVDPIPRMKTGRIAQRTPVGPKSTKREARRRKVERRLYRRLGSYFQPPNGGDEWTRPPLLVKVLGYLEDLERSGDLEDLGDLKDLQNLEELEIYKDPEDPEDLDDLEDLENREDLVGHEDPEDL